MNGHGPDWLCGLSRWPWASSGTARFPSLLSPENSSVCSQAGGESGCRACAQQTRASVGGFWGGHAGHTVDPNTYLLSSCPGWS